MADPHASRDQHNPTQTAADVVQQPSAPAEPETPVEQQQRRWLSTILVPLLAIFTAVLLGAILVFFTAPVAKIAEASGMPAGSGFDFMGRLKVTLNAFSGLYVGAFGNLFEPGTIPGALSGTLVQSTPYILAGLAVAFGFKAGLFNIGVEGQLLIGALGSAAAGVWLPSLLGVESLSAWIYLPVALLAGAVAGGLWGAIPGYLRAKTGAHEVITTIMLNYTALRLVDYLIVSGPMKDPNASAPRTPFIGSGAALPQFIGRASDPALTGGNTYAPLFTSTNPIWDLRLHLGILIALGMALLINWFLNRTPRGFEVRTVGTNPVAARYAGMNIVRTIVFTMALSGAMAGLAGASEVLGREHNMKSVFSGGLGFDSIAIALLARSNPLAIIPAAIFWAALRSGAGTMQLRAGISIDLISIIQALVIILIAADQIVRWLYRLKQDDSGQLVFTSGWGK